MSPDHTTLPFPATFTRFVNERFGDKFADTIKIIAEAPINPKHKIWEKNNERFLINTDKKIKIYDRHDKISLDLPDGQKERQEAIKLALSVAALKGWDIDKMSVNGSHSLKKEVRRQIVELKADKAKVEVKEQKIEKKKEKKKLPPNAVTQSLTDVKEKQIERLSKEQIQSIKDKLNANILLKYAEHKYNILISDFEITNDNKINDKRNKQKPKNVIDFMTKTCNISFKEVLPELHKLYIEQEKKENTAKMKIGISNDKSLASVSDWQEKEITTFTELANTIKNNNYSAVTKFKDNYRKIANVEQLSNIAIFDIDNDPNYPELSIKKAKELLKNTTYLLITSKSHQIKKGDKPAVDRFRIIVPLKETFEANKNEYRASMTRLAENLGLSQYVDKKALSDMVRFYYKSPVNAYVFINNTKQALDVQTIKESVQADMAEKQRLQAEKLKDSSEALNRENNALKRQILANSEDYHTVIDVDAMNKLPIDKIYQELTGNEIKDDGSSYRIAKGFEAGTSSSHDTLSFIDGTQLAHDFKTNNTYNVVTMLKEIKGFNVYESASYLEKEFNVNLKVPNSIYYQKIIAKALCKSTNDKTLKENIKEISGAKLVKLDFKNEQIQIADKCFSFNNLDIKKENMIAQLRENRNREAEQQSSRQRM